MKRIIRTLLLAAVAFVLAAGDAHAYDSDYNVKIESRLDPQTGQWVSVVTFTSALDGKDVFHLGRRVSRSVHRRCELSARSSRSEVERRTRFAAL